MASSESPKTEADHGNDDGVDGVVDDANYLNGNDNNADDAADDDDDYLGNSSHHNPTPILLPPSTTTQTQSEAPKNVRITDQDTIRKRRTPRRHTTSPPPPAATTNNPTQTRSSPTKKKYKSSSMKSLSAFLPRLIARNLPYEQSKNKFSVYNNNRHRDIYRLYLLNWFHVLLRWSVYKSVPLLLCVWTICILFFAGIYCGIDNMNKDLDCGLGDPGVPIKWATAFAFSLETCTTVGYGLPGSTNAFFEANCPEVQIAIYAQMTWSMMFNAFIFAFFFVALSKSEARGAQLVFSDKMVIHTDTYDKRVYAKVQVFDLDSSHGVVEAHVRIYAFTKDFKLEPLRISYPDDDQGATLVPSLPIQIIHHVDHHSVLSPRRRMPFVTNGRGLLNRSADSEVGNREEIICPVCCEAYGTYERLRKHVEYYAATEAPDDDTELPRHLSHKHLRIPEIRNLTLEEVKLHIESSISEVVVVVEGIDPQASGTFQAIQSYKYDDIVWEGQFESCLKVNNDKFTVDMQKYHMVRIPDEYHYLNPDYLGLVDDNNDNDDDENDDDYLGGGFFSPPVAEISTSLQVNDNENNV
eukprot:CAMPEP_0119558454 /NCGR_PEP_ID=MMETSP1352-20130426/10797_1 /TAXON_ID=265584 /ORGANISM="Stauroneis constricta, Strain CCMP1120" /LENGTH=580 /DNA_ID=CAMNT_0007605823 /DNA_START=62 /DNA_END=1804 /DNA_ORIENTATION=+